MRAIALVVLLVGCTATAEPPPGPRACESREPERAGLVRSLRFEVAEGGVTEGFDVDESVGPPAAATSCRARDYRDPDGRVGIDNQLTILVPTLESMVGEGTLDSLLQGAINNGQLLLAVSLEGVDDPIDDDCVAISVRVLRGTPLLGTDGFLLDGQTLEVDPTAPVGRYEGAALRGGVAETGAFELSLPIQILNAQFVVDLHHARVRVEMHEDGSMHGVIAGGISNAMMIEIARGIENLPPDLVDMVAGFIQAIADLDPDASGTCTAFSASMVFDAAPGFVSSAP
jgi:hypothetical protein